MKQRRVERVERRRTLVELNLVSDRVTRASGRRRGCLSFLAPGVLVVAAIVAGILGLH